MNVVALVPSWAGTLASQGLTEAWFPVFNMVGLVLIFLGDVYSRPRTRGGNASAAVGAAPWS